MIKTSQDRQPGLGTTGISGTLTLTKTGTTARTATFPDAAITVAGSATALTSGRVPYVTTGGLLNNEAGFEYNASTNVLTTPAITASGTVTVPNGSAAAPGIRLTTEASGLFRSATSLGIAANGIMVGAFAAPNGTTLGGQFVLQTPSAAEFGLFRMSATNSYFAISGGTGDSSNGIIKVYGSTHATKADYVEFTRGATVSAFFDGSGILTTNAGRKITVRSVTSAAGTTTLDGTDYCAVCTGSTTQTFTLPAAASGRVLFIKNRSTGNLTVNRAGDDTIDGTTTVVLTAGQSLQIVANGTDWVIL
jgi:hypothetical protein